MKQTLEEAMESYLDSPTPHSYKRAVKFGAKWQQERSYSEEEVREAFKIGHRCARQGSYNDITEQEDFTEWFEQFKKSNYGF